MNRKLSFLSVIFSLFVFLGAVLVPIRAEAAGSKISFYDEIQSVSTGDAVPLRSSYSLMALNEDYTASVSSTVYSNALPGFAKTVKYAPSYSSTINVVSTELFYGSFSGLVGSNVISLHIPITISGLLECDEVINSVFWIETGGKRYETGSIYNPWINLTLDTPSSTDLLRFGVDLYLSNQEMYNYYAPNLYIDAYYYSDLYGSNYKIEENYIEYLMRNRSGDVRNLTISYDNASYICTYYEEEKTGLLRNIIDGIRNGVIPNIQNYGQGIISNIQSYCQSIITNIQNYGNTILDSLTWNFAELRSHLNNHFSNLASNMQAWYNGLTKTINNGIERLINNYSGTGTTDAANKFDDSAGDLEQVESDLTTITNSSIGSYTESAFDTSVITSLGSSLVYVVTWFTNFWNMGGLFTSILNVGLALSVAFFILRLRGGS